MEQVPQEETPLEEQMAAIQFLAHEIGPRPATSAAEARAAAYVNSKMRQSNLDVDVQILRTVPTSSIPMGLIYLAMAVTPAISLYSRPAALAVCLAALIALTAEQLGFPLLSAWLPGGKSQNVIGTRPAAQEGRQHLIVVAHLDTARSNLLNHPRIAGSRRRLFLLLVTAAIALPLLVGLQWWTGTAALWWAQWAPAGYAALALLLVLHQEIVMPLSPGANDNASGVAVLLRLAEELEGLQYTTLWLVASGGKEAGLSGIRHFLRHYPFPLPSTYLLNLDTVGCGELGIIAAEGALLPKRAAPQLLELAGQSESGDITIDADPRVYYLDNSDALVPLRRGFQALSIMALEGGRPAHRHWPTDTFDKIRPELLERTTRLVVGIARRLDRRAEQEE